MSMDKPVQGEGQERRKLDIYQRILSLEQEFAQDRAKAIQPLAEAYLEAGRPQAAIELIERHLKKQPGTKDLQLVLAQAYFDNFHNERARQILGALGDFVLDNARAQALLGELAIEDNKPDMARGHLESALKLNGVNRQAVILLRGLGADLPEPEESNEAIDYDLTAKLAFERWDREPFGRALLHVLIALVVCTGSFFLYKWRADIGYQAAQLVMKARQAMDSPDVNGLRAAIDIYHQVLAIDDDSRFALAGLAEAHALLWFEYGLEAERANAEKWIAAAVDDDIERSDRYMAQGLAMLKNGRDAEVKQLAAGLLKMGAQDERLFYLLGAARRRLGELDGGRDELKKAADLNTKAPFYAWQLGDAYYLDNDMRNAHFFWERAERSNLAHPIAAARAVIAKAWKGSATEELDRKLAELTALDEELTGPVGKIAVLWAQAELGLRESRHKEAEAAAAKALELDADNPLLLDVKGRVLTAAGEARRGLASLKQAVALVPGSKHLNYSLIEALARAGEYDQALDAITKLAPLYGKEPEYLIKVGDIWRDKGDLVKATAEYNKAVHINESYAQAYYALGYVEQLQKKWQEAANFYQKAAELRDRYPEVYTQMGVIHVNLNDLEGADGWFDDAEKMYLISRIIPPHEVKAFYKVAINAFGAAGSKAGKYRDQWTKKAAEYKRI